jgi:hypothetical protein
VLEVESPEANRNVEADPDTCPECVERDRNPLLMGQSAGLGSVRGGGVSGVKIDGGIDLSPGFHPTP